LRSCVRCRNSALPEEVPNCPALSDNRDGESQTWTNSTESVSKRRGLQVVFFDSKNESRCLDTVETPLPQISIVGPGHGRGARRALEYHPYCLCACTGNEAERCNQMHRARYSRLVVVETGALVVVRSFAEQPSCVLESQVISGRQFWRGSVGDSINRSGIKLIKSVAAS